MLASQPLPPGFAELWRTGQRARGRFLQAWLKSLVGRRQVAAAEARIASEVDALRALVAQAEPQAPMRQPKVAA